METLCICVKGNIEIEESCGSNYAFSIEIMSIEKKKSGIFKMQYHTYTDGDDGTKPSYVYLKLYKQKLYYQSVEYKFYDIKEIPKWDTVKREFILPKYRITPIRLTSVSKLNVASEGAQHNVPRWQIFNPKIAP